MGVSGGGRVWRKDRDRHGPALADAPAEEAGIAAPTQQPADWAQGSICLNG